MSTEPLVPYLHVPDLVLVPKGALGNFPPADFSLKPFGTLVAIGVYLGAYLAIRQGKRLGLDEKKLLSFIVWVVGIGFVGGHVLDTVFYFPEKIATDPLSLVRLWEGLSSFGGFIGATLGVFVWRWRYGEPVLPYADTVASAFPLAWVFGRSGCTLAHDHPGVLSNAWFAVRYPEGGRFDLGLYEMLLTIPLAAAFLWLRRKPRPWGFYLAVMSIAYAPSRFALDFLRIRQGATADARYLALTPAQWSCFALLVVGVALLWRTLDKQDFALPVPLEPQPQKS
jgi:phosphatidylglycerol:prolipoprotein diacylglycerol transferase